ncbi:hypothetical protein GCM10010298_07960 [Streptomyces microflavus]|uniref:Uncharacterized protein n=1 Tax=Streptomyces microflavus TaxID=1919 RepID=A0A7J0CP27_STRMI|nr:hypothetical protein Smic_20130 [Streptomyces microflavus]GGX46854.1 hypothetical protein GCM10010298_07960 [Streptomyces microflavus]
MPDGMHGDDAEEQRGEQQELPEDHAPASAPDSAGRARHAGHPTPGGYAHGQWPGTPRGTGPLKRADAQLRE